MRRLAAEQQLRARAAQRASQARAELANAKSRSATVPEFHARDLIGRGSKLVYCIFPASRIRLGTCIVSLRHVEAAIAAGMQASWIRRDELLAHSHEMADADLIVMWRVPWDDRIARACRNRPSRWSQSWFLTSMTYWWTPTRFVKT